MRNKFLLLLAVLMLVGVPLDSFVNFFILGMAATFLFIFEIRTKTALCALAFAAIHVAIALPRVDVTAYLLTPVSLEHTNIPDPVKQEGLAFFEAKYPRQNWCDPSYGFCWQSIGHDKAGVKRFVSKGEFTVSEFRHVGAPLLFAKKSSNLGNTNFYSGRGKIDFERRDIPFFYHVRNFDQATHTELCFNGKFFSDDQTFESTCVTPDPSLRNLYIPHLERGKQRIEFRYLEALDFKSISKNVLKVLGVLLSFAAFIYRRSFRWEYLSPIFVFLVFGGLSYEQFQYPLFNAGNDGLTHAGFGTNILALLAEGKVFEAFRGSEDVFYFMPGLRYFWPFFIELGGYNTWFFLAFFSCLPLAKMTLGKELGIKHQVLVAIFAHAVLFKLSKFAAQGFPETLAYVFFLYGFVLYLRVWKKPVEFWLSFGSFFLLTLSVFLRPNLVLAVFVLCLVGLPRHLRSFRGIAALLGCLPVFFTLIHNWVYGDVFVLFTSSALIKENLLCPPDTYAYAFMELLRFSPGPALETLTAHMSRMFLPIGKVVLIGAALRQISRAWRLSREMRLLSICILCLYVPMFFWHASGRYSWLMETLMLLLLTERISSFFFYSSTDTGFSLKATLDLMQRLKCKAAQMTGVAYLKFMYRPFIFPLFPLLKIIGKNKVVFDLGCGSGFFLSAVAEECAPQALYGAEITPELVALANQNLSQVQVPKKIELFNGLELPQEISQADVVVMNDVFHHIPLDMRQRFMANLHVRMKPGSILLFKDMDAGKRFWVLFNKLHDLIFSGEIGSEISSSEAKDMLQESGFKLTQSDYYRYVVYAHYVHVAQR